MPRTILAQFRCSPLLLVVLLAGTVLGLRAREAGGPALDREAQRWVDRTFKAMTLDQKVGQLLVPTFDSTYTSSDSEAFDELLVLAKEIQVGGFVVIRRHRADAWRAAQPHLRLRDPRAAARGGVDGQPAPAGGAAAAAHGRRLRVGRGHAHRARHVVSARDGVRGSRRRGTGVRGRPDHRHRGARDWRARQLRAGGRRQQQRAQPGHQHAVVRRGSGEGRRARVRVRARPARGWCARHAEALPGPRRHGRGQPSRAARDQASARAARADRAPAVPDGDGGGRGGGDGGAHRAAGARSRAEHAGDAQPADRDGFPSRDD